MGDRHIPLQLDGDRVVGVGAPAAPSYPEAEAMRQFALGDIVEIREGSPFAYEFKGIQLKIVSLRIDPEGKQWASTIDFKPGYLPRHRGNGFYDSETTDIDAEHFSLIRPGGVAQRQPDPIRESLQEWVDQGYIDAEGDHCGAAAYCPALYVKSLAALGSSSQDSPDHIEIKRLSGLLANAQRIIAEYKARAIEVVRAEIASGREVDQLREALRPFAAVAESDIGQDETDADIFQPIRSGYNREPLITVGDMRRASQVTSTQSGGVA